MLEVKVFCPFRDLELSGVDADGGVGGEEAVFEVVQLFLDK